MRIAFRADASSQIGTGHIMRCLTLAGVLAQRGAHTRFICRHLPDFLHTALVAAGHEVVHLTTQDEARDLNASEHAAWLGTSQSTDAKATLGALEGGSWDWVVVDHYALDSKWERQVRPAAHRILAIDDLADRDHEVDALLDQNAYEGAESRYLGKVPGGSSLWLGPRYALLRPAFEAFHREADPRTGEVRRVLVFFGGVDASNHTAKTLDTLAGMGLRHLHVDVVIGAQHPARAEVEATCAVQGYTLHVQTPSMPELMRTSDLAIGAGGTAVWERCCLGLPTLALCTAENQRRQLRDASRMGLVVTPDDKAELGTHLRSLIDNEGLRNLISRLGVAAVDGRGASRVATGMGCTGIAMRRANEEDSLRLFGWRNHPGIRAVSRSSEPIDWETHETWFNKVLADSGRVLLIGERDGVAMGVVRFDLSAPAAEVSIYLVPGVGQPGVGGDLLRAAELWLNEHRPGINLIQAHVLGGNDRSQKLFLGAGYQIDSTYFSKRVPIA